MDFNNIRIEADGPLAYLTLNRPDKINALSRETIREITSGLNLLAGDPEARVIVIRAAGKHFCAGHDLSEMVNGDTAQYRDIFQQCCHMMTLLHKVPQPVIAQVRGLATAAGCQLVAACDLALAEPGARFATPGVKIGLFCSTPMVPLSRCVGRKRALEMLLTGREVGAEEAAMWGLINRVVPAEQLADEVRSLASGMAEASRLTLEIGKTTFYEQIDQPESVGYAAAKNAIALNLTTIDAQEGVQAFLDKRTPVWRDK
jgi:enoyl-CoA hydratase/carnithine racemase